VVQRTIHFCFCQMIPVAHSPPPWRKQYLWIFVWCTQLPVCVIWLFVLEFFLKLHDSKQIIQMTIRWLNWIG
jgi:hypothetical protein